MYNALFRMSLEIRFIRTKARLNDPAELVHATRFEASTWDEGFDRARGAISPETFRLARQVRKQVDYLWAISRDYPEVQADPDLVRCEKDGKFWGVVESVFDRCEVHEALRYYALCLHEDKCNLYDSDENIAQRMNRKLEDVGVLSLTSRSDCRVMWAQYADNHQGIVLIFETDQDSFLRTARQVEYVENRPISTVDSVVNNIYLKSNAWEYEREYRAITKTGNSVHGLDHGVLSGVIMGIRMTEESRADVRRILNGDGEVELFQAIADRATFSICH
jgi:Protein of unknown function (DUF2971)